MPEITVMSPGQTLAHYRFTSKLGEGGMGEVWQATDTRLNRDVAIKLLPGHLADDSDARQRLRREAMAAAALDHPYICKIFDVAEDKGALFFVMEYVRGETLSSRLRAGRLALPEALRIAGEIAEAIEEAHTKRFVHRDLKPGNIMVTAQNHVKVLDFGLAKRAAPSEIEPTLTVDGAQLTVSGKVIGTPEYMSPEQACGGAIDHRSDLFSFGIILCELLSAKHPFRRRSALETMTAIVREPPDFAVSSTSELPTGWIVLMRRLLAKSPEERYDSIAEVRADMARLASAPATQEESGPRQIPLIGREQEKAELVRLLEAALAGRGSLVFIGGEPGVGKTHLTRAILREASRRASLPITGHCYEMEGAPPYVPFIEMLENCSRVLPRGALRFALGDAAAEVARLMPELRRIFADIPPAIELPPEQQRRFMFNAYREFVERGASVTPFVAVYEDLHWADEPTLLLLHHLAPAFSRLPVLIVGTYRDVELDVNRPFARILESLLREKLATRISLRRLPVGGVEAMLRALSGQAPPQELVRIVFRETEGNPFFVEEVFRHLEDEGRLFDEQRAWRTELRADELRVPEGVRLVIGRRLERLGVEARRVLTTAAVIGRTFSLRLLEALESARPDAVLEVAEEAERAHLVTPERSGRETRYRFVHELVRQTLAEGLSMPRRQRLHARIAEAIEQVYVANEEGQASVLAHHLYQAGASADEGKAVSWLTRAAGEAASAGAHEDALAHLDNALSLVEGENSVRVAGLYVERANVLRALMRPDDAVTALERALALFEANSDAHRFAEACVPLAIVHAWAARLVEARDACQRGLGLSGAMEAPARVSLLWLVALVASITDEVKQALPIAAEAGRLPAPSEPATMRMASGSEAMMWYHAGQLRLAEQTSRRIYRLCESAGDLWGQMEAAWVLTIVVMYSGRIGEAATIANKALPTAERIGHWGAVWCCKLPSVEKRVADGNLDGAVEHCRELAEFDRLHGVAWAFISKAELGCLLRLTGHLEEAEDLCQRTIAAEPVRTSWSMYIRAALALVLAQTGDGRASEALEETLLLAPCPGDPISSGSSLGLLMLIEALAFGGRFTEAAKLCSSAEQVIEGGFGIGWPSPLPSTSAGIAATCGRDWLRAEAHHRTAIHQADTMPHRIAQPIARFWYADMLRARNEPGDAERTRALLDEALAMFESTRMPLYARQTREKLVALSA